MIGDERAHTGKNVFLFLMQVVQQRIAFPGWDSAF